MPDTIADLARRMARLERRVTKLERAQRAPRPPWRNLPLTGDTAVPDPDRPPQLREMPWDELEFSGRIGLPGSRAVDGTVIALLPDDYEPAATRTLPVASDAQRRALQLELDREGRVTLRVPGAGGGTRATWISLDGVSCRSDNDDE
ncbi:hypothetical protein [Streptomyces jumonjinensis]|uniref:Uncharacterized protein n=1 Tax=Streptomyces jumonjinensis TaxID=1945 RepID=A0A646KT70_STRJU|nr:hypothetical protein [Streptomyces jumonjinensis]MQT05435.1 hypothetical protein [Streptomyces jumonjinensis]